MYTQKRTMCSFEIRNWEERLQFYPCRPPPQRWMGSASQGNIPRHSPISRDYGHPRSFLTSMKVDLRQTLVFSYSPCFLHCIGRMTSQSSLPRFAEALLNLLSLL